MEINSNRQNQALAILTIGTAILGVGIFEIDFPIGNAFSSLWLYIRYNVSIPVVDLFAIVKLVLVGIVAGNYFVMFLHVMQIMRQTDYVTGSQLANGPLRHLGIEIWFFITIFVIDVFQKSATAS